MLIHIFGMLNLSYNIAHAPVAQLDRVPGYEPGGQEFESSRARQLFYLGICARSSAG